MTDTAINPPPHPITVTTNADNEQELTWSCPTTCPDPGECEIVQRLRRSLYREHTDGLPNGQYIAGLDWLGTTVTHPDGTSISLPSYEPEISRYTVSALHRDDPNRHLFAITVEERRDGTWAVKNGEITYLDNEGTWSDGWGQGDWAERHFFDVDTALALAQAAAPGVTVNGITAAQAWTWSDNARRVEHALGKDAAQALEKVPHTQAALDVLAALAGQLTPRDAAAWMTEPRYACPRGVRNAVQEIAAGGGHDVLHDARSTATAPIGA